MRSIVILAVICSVGAYSNSDEAKNEAIAKCGEKCNVDLSDGNYEKLRTDKAFLTSDASYCLVDCALDYAKRAEGNEQTYYEEYMELINKTSDDSFKNRSFTREELVSLLNQCQSRGLSGAAFLKCIKFTEHPFLTFYMNYV